MSATQQVRKLDESTPPDAEQVRKWLAAGTEVFPGIWKTPGVCGGDACAGHTRITVGGLVEWRQLGSTDAELLYNFPSLTQRDLNNAWEYARTHEEEIACQIEENNRDDD